MKGNQFIEIYNKIKENVINNERLKRHMLKEYSDYEICNIEYIDCKYNVNVILYQNEEQIGKLQIIIKEFN